MGQEAEDRVAGSQVAMWEGGWAGETAQGRGVR